MFLQCLKITCESLKPSPDATNSLVPIGIGHISLSGHNFPFTVG